jgi:hypothetical protein
VTDDKYPEVLSNLVQGVFDCLWPQGISILQHLKIKRRFGGDWSFLGLRNEGAHPLLASKRNSGRYAQSVRS